jgi:phosphoglycolate phosphatase
MAQQNFDVIVFDWDGTLMNSTAHITRSLQAACADLDLPIPSDISANYVIGLGLQEALRCAVPTLKPEGYAALAARYRFHYLARAQTIELFAGVRDMLVNLRAQGYVLAIATGKSRVGLNRALEETGLMQMFDATRCADETFSKPHPAMLHELMQELEREAARIVMIGDTTHDLQMAANAGTAALAVAYGAHPREALLALTPHFCANTVSELADWLERHA